MWIKICGNTTPEDAQLAVDSGANAVSFVFAQSPRRVTSAQVRAITPHLPRAVEKYGVFVDPTLEQVIEAVTECGLSGVQLHSCFDATLALQLREHFAQLPARGRLGILRAVHYTRDLETQLAALSGDHAVDAVLIDSRTANAVGGTGLAFDWRAAQSGFFRSAPHLRLIAAGGLNPDNVAEAICTLHPWGVDVVTGVEASPGRKDPAKVKAFIKNARAAALQVERSRQPVEV